MAKTLNIILCKELKKPKAPEKTHELSLGLPILSSGYHRNFLRKAKLIERESDYLFAFNAEV
jgi:hypothetical protein